jgi:hypothetical protein
MKRKLLLCLAALALTYCVLAYIFMWPPVVRNIKWAHHRATSSANPCINNLRQIDGAIQEWASRNGKHAGDPVTLEQIKPYIRLDSSGKMLICPIGGKYSVTVVGAPPTCRLGAIGTNYSKITRVRVDYFYYNDAVAGFHTLP